MTEQLTAPELGRLVGETVERVVEWRTLGLLGREGVADGCGGAVPPDEVPQ